MFPAMTSIVALPETAGSARSDWNVDFTSSCVRWFGVLVRVRQAGGGEGGEREQSGLPSAAERGILGPGASQQPWWRVGAESKSG